MKLDTGGALDLLAERLRPMENRAWPKHGRARSIRWGLGACHPRSERADGWTLVGALHRLFGVPGLQGAFGTDIVLRLYCELPVRSMLPYDVQPTDWATMLLALEGYWYSSADAEREQGRVPGKKALKLIDNAKATYQAELEYE